MNKNVTVEVPPNVNIYNFLFEDWKILEVDGLKCESISPFDPKAIEEYRAQGISHQNANIKISNAKDVKVCDNNIVTIFILSNIYI